MDWRCGGDSVEPAFIIAQLQSYAVALNLEVGGISFCPCCRDSALPAGITERVSASHPATARLQRSPGFLHIR